MKSTEATRRSQSGDGAKMVLKNHKNTKHHNIITHSNNESHIGQVAATSAISTANTSSSISHKFLSSLKAFTKGYYNQQEQKNKNKNTN